MSTDDGEDKRAQQDDLAKLIIDSEAARSLTAYLLGIGVGSRVKGGAC